jgi:ribosomal protein L20
MKTRYKKVKNLSCLTKLRLEIFPKAKRNTYIGRKNKKRILKTVKVTKIKQKLNKFNISYSEFRGELKKQNVDLNSDVIFNLINLEYL